jgi:hypothetical protein
MFPLRLVPDWLPLAAATVPNFAIGVLILVFRKRIRMFIKSLIRTMSEGAEFWASRAILIGGLFLIALPTFLVYSTVSSALAR